MHTAATELSGRAAVLAATGHHPYARLSTGGDILPRAFVEGTAAVWLADAGRGPAGSALGDPERVLRVVVRLAGRGELNGVRRLHLPRVDAAALAATRLPAGEPDHWVFRWATSPPPAQPGEHRVVRLGPGTDPAVGALLDRAFPGSFSRPGDLRIRHWYGVWNSGRLVACGADRSRGGVGSLAAIAVDPDARGQGIGAALTAAMARELAREFDVVTLGVMAGNHQADRLYRRLGFTHATARTSVDIQ